MQIQFDRKAEVIVGNLSFHSDKFDFEFDVEFSDDDSEKNHAEVLIYNLSRNTVNQIKTGVPLIINAGYGNDVGSVFVGVVYEASTTQNGVDRETTVKAVDGTNQRDRLRVNKTYAAGTRASQILTDLCRLAGLPIGAMSLPKDVIYRGGRHVTGPILKRIKGIAQECGARFKIVKGVAYFRKPGEGQEIGFIFNAERGLIGSPEPITWEDDDGNEFKGYNVRALLNHRIQPNVIIQVQSKIVSGRFRVRKGRHIYSEQEMVTEMEVV